MKGNKVVKIKDVVGGEWLILMVVMLGGGSNALLETPIILFRNDLC